MCSPCIHNCALLYYTYYYNVSTVFIIKTPQCPEWGPIFMLKLPGSSMGSSHHIFGTQRQVPDKVMGCSSSTEQKETRTKAVREGKTCPDLFSCPLPGPVACLLSSLINPEVLSCRITHWLWTKDAAPCPSRPRGKKLQTQEEKSKLCQWLQDEIVGLLIWISRRGKSHPNSYSLHSKGAQQCRPCL